MLKSKKSEQLDELYKPQLIEIILSPKEENKLTELEKKSIKITIKISEENQYKKNIFTPLKFTCKLECPELESSVNRSLEDFEWLKTQLNEKYPMVYIPPTPDKKSIKDASMFANYISKFLNSLLRRKILRTSTIVQDFLTSDEKTFLTFKKSLSEKNFKLSANMDNYKSTKENLKFEFQKGQISLPDKYVKRMEPTKGLYNELESIISQVTNDFNNLNKHIKELGDTCGKLTKCSKDTDQSEITKKVFDKLKTIFTKYSTFYLKKSEFYEKDFKVFFHYIKLKLNEQNVLFSQYSKKKNEYENLGIDYFNKREKLFNDKKYNKWELTKEDEAKLDTFKDNKEEAMKYICKEIGQKVNMLKLQVGSFCNIIMKQFNLINKYVGEQMKEYYEKIIEKNKELTEEELEISRLINIKIE